MLNPRLAIDLSGDTVRVVIGSPGGRMWGASAALPAGSANHGTVTNAAEVGKVVKQILGGVELKESHAMIAVNDSLASFRVMTFPRETSEPKIDAAVRAQLPMDGTRMGMQRYELTQNGNDRTVFAVAFDRARVKAVAEAVRFAGLDPSVVELKSLCLARMAPVSECVVVDLAADPAEVYLISRDLPRLWHTFRVSSDETETASVAAGVKSVLGFHRRQADGNGLPSDVAVFITEQAAAERIGPAVQDLLGQPVSVMTYRNRVAPEVQDGAYLACLGLLMRRR
jgi:hypothetical protein